MEDTLISIGTCLFEAGEVIFKGALIYAASQFIPSEKRDKALELLTGILSPSFTVIIPVNRRDEGRKPKRSQKGGRKTKGKKTSKRSRKNRKRR